MIEHDDKYDVLAYMNENIIEFDNSTKMLSEKDDEKDQHIDPLLQ